MAMLADEHSTIVDSLLNRLTVVQGANTVKERYYTGQQRLKDLGISIPPQMRNLDVVIGWPSTTVDVLDERLDWNSWMDTGDRFGLSDVFYSNNLDVEAPLAHLDALIYGVAFVAVSTGGAGEPSPLITVESPKYMTCEFDARTRRVSAAVSVRYKDTSLVGEDSSTVDTVTLYLPDATYWLQRPTYGGGWTVIDQDDHQLGVVPVARLVNRPRAGAMGGRSEITNAVRGYTDAALRTLVGSEVAREFYAAPQRWIMGAPESFFVDESGNPRSAWQSYMGRFLGLESYEDDQGKLHNPEIGQFPSNTMDPYFNQIKALAQLLSAETAIPATYLGFVTENPSSADAIRTMEARLVKRAERRQAMFGHAWTQVGQLSVMVRDGIAAADSPPELQRVRPLWTDAATPTKAAAADEVQKMVAQGVYTPDGDYTAKRLGMNSVDLEMWKADHRKSPNAALKRLQQAAAVSPEAAALADRVAPDGAADGDLGA